MSESEQCGSRLGGAPSVTPSVSVALPLSFYTTLRLGGPAGHLTEVGDERELVASVRADGSLLVIGGGSNIVVADDGLPGGAVLVRTHGMAIRRLDDRVRLRVAAGEPWDDLVDSTVQLGCSGLETLSGIPGTVGATPIQNVDAYGHAIAEAIVAVRVYDRTADRILRLTTAQCRFGYRTSIFKTTDRFTVLDVELELARSSQSRPIRYAQLAQTLGLPLGESAPTQEVRNAVLSLRTSKGMVLDAGDHDTWSAGSFFLNPLVEERTYDKIAAAAAAAGHGQPASWPAGNGRAKVSAAWLIERAGFHKGYAQPDTGVAISTKHVLALTNRSTGSTSELLRLAGEIRAVVAHSYGVVLQPEPTLANCSLDLTG